MEPRIPILPLFDLHRAVVEVRVDGHWHSFHVTDAPALDRALANAVSRPLWHAPSSTLWVTTPRNGHAAGDTRAFSLVKFSSVRPTAKVGG